MCPVKLKALVVFAARLAIEQVVVLPGEPQFQLGPESWVKDTKVKPPGNESVKLALVAEFGPRFVTVIVKVTSVSALTCDELVLLVRLRSALFVGTCVTAVD